MIDRTRLKVVAATVTVAAVGAGAGIAATRHGAANSGSAATTSLPTAGRPAPPGGGPAGGFDTDLAAAASYLRTTKAKLQTQLRSGKTLAQIPKATSGKSTAGMIQAIVSAETRQIRTSQKAGKVTKAQAKQMLSGLTQRVTEFVNGRRPSGSPPGGRGRPPANSGK